MHQVDPKEPKLLSDQVFLGRTQRECKPNLKIAQENKDHVEEEEWEFRIVIDGKESGTKCTINLREIKSVKSD